MYDWSDHSEMRLTSLPAVPEPRSYQSCVVYGRFVAYSESFVEAVVLDAVQTRDVEVVDRTDRSCCTRSRFSSV